MLGKYKLLNGVPVETNDTTEWAEWMCKADKDRRVKLSEVGDMTISTVFLGLDHNFSGAGEPLLYETLVFGGPLDGEMIRTATRKQAKQAHAEMIRRAMNVED
jgi:hypothetical protein